MELETITRVQPIGAMAFIKWNDGDYDQQQVYISFGEEIYNDFGDPVSDNYGVKDGDIFFYGCIEDKQDYLAGKEDWTLIEWSYVYPQDLDTKE
jgi:hypothetical protein